MNSTAILIFASLQYSADKFGSAGSRAARRVFSALTDRAITIGREVLPHDLFLAVPAGEQKRFARNQLHVLIQQGETFGDRLHASVDQVFQRGYDRILILGNDCPQLDTRILRDALDRFETVSAVIGPDHRGGVFLIGVTAETFPVLSSIRWNQNTDFNQITSELRRKNVCLSVLAKCHDIDNAQDLNRVVQHLQAHDGWRLRSLLMGLFVGDPSVPASPRSIRVVPFFLKETQITNQLPPPLVVVLPLSLRPRFADTI